MKTELHKFCEDKEFMAKMDALPLEPCGEQELTPEQLEMWQRGQDAYNNAWKDKEFKVIP